jgi:hypothetical protein
VTSKSLNNSRAGENGRISIPSRYRQQALQTFELPLRLRHVLEANIRRLGELHGRRFAEVAEWRNCGPGTVADLKKLVRRLQPDDAPPSVEANADLLVVPPSARDLLLAELPLTVRLDAVLQKCGFETLGDVDGADVQKLLAMKNCGPGTIQKLKEVIRRAGAGEFSAPPKKDLLSNLRQMALAIDHSFARLSKRDQTIYQARLPGLKNWPRTLQDIATEYRMTRERVRQIVNEATKKIKRGGGPQLGRAIEALAAACEKKSTPLTQPRMAEMLETCGLSRPPQFYLGVLDHMARAVPEPAEESA